MMRVIISRLRSNHLGQCLVVSRINRTDRRGNVPYVILMSGIIAEWVSWIPSRNSRFFPGIHSTILPVPAVQERMTGAGAGRTADGFTLLSCRREGIRSFSRRSFQMPASMIASTVRCDQRRMSGAACSSQKKLHVSFLITFGKKRSSVFS